MDILLDKPVLLIAGILSFIFLIFMMIKVIREIYFNHLLNQKQNQMRMSGNSKTFSKRIGFLTSTALAPILIFVLIVSLSANPPIYHSGDLQGIRSSNDVIEIYKDFQNLMGYYSTNDDWFREEVATGSPESEQNDGGSDDYSETNVQVQGIDEMDNVVTDGKYIYQMRNNQVLITLAYTISQGTEVLSNYKVIDYIDEETTCPTGMYVTGLYVDSDYLIVIGSEYQYNCRPFLDGEIDAVEPYYYSYWHGYNNNVKIYVYDKQNDFELSHEYELSGNLIGTRKIDDTLYIITNSWIPLSNNDINVDDYLPNYTTNNQTVTTKYEDISYVQGIAPNSFTSFFAIDLENKAVDMEVVLGDHGYNLYVSHNNIYLVGTIYFFISDDQETTNDAMPTYETRTAIQKIAINGANLEYVKTGTVLGYTLNQFSMDESNGYLRIATTSGWWGDGINNRLYILDENLEEVSKLENLGKPRETIRSVRFVGDYGYIVTFEQTDPFYVINLSDPLNPTVEGELEIPGFSSYLQPLNDQYMLGIGFGDSNGGTNGLKISIYDISDKTNPVEFAVVIFDYADFGWGWSSATYNHKDLLVSLSKGIIALPFSTYQWSQESGYVYNSGILVYDFDEVNGLTKSGFITHDQNTDEEVYVYKIKFIDQYFYTISNDYIKASLISDPETILNSVTLPDDQYQYGSHDSDLAE